jgi:hypothetical protein
LWLNPRGNSWLTAVRRRMGMSAELASDVAGDLEAGGGVLGEHDIEEDAIGSALADGGDGLARGVDGGDLVAVGLANGGD